MVSFLHDRGLTCIFAMYCELYSLIVISVNVCQSEDDDHPILISGSCAQRLLNIFLKLLTKFTVNNEIFKLFAILH